MKKAQEKTCKESAEGNIVFNGKAYPCGTSLTMDMIGGKWKAVILWYLHKEKKRYTELRKDIPQITERMLSIQLQQLEKDGIVHKLVYATKPPLKVEYMLTAFGKTLIPVLKAVAKWGSSIGD